MKASIKFLFLSAFISITLLSVAHEYWIAPVKYKVKSKEAFSVNCYAGEDFKEAIWAKRKDRTLQVNIFHEKNKNDIITIIFEKVISLKIEMMLLPSQCR